MSEKQVVARFLRVTDPETGRFLFEYDPEREIVVWYERSRRIEIKLERYKKAKVGNGDLVRSK